MESAPFHLNYKGNSLILDLTKGGKILSLILQDPLKVPHTIISGDSSNITNNGSFLMYPWVNRLSSLSYENSFITPYHKDGNGTALHGFFAGCERDIVQSTPQSITIKVSTRALEEILKENPIIRHFPLFTETFLLNEGAFSVITEFLPLETKENSLKFGYGYHPYLQMDDLSIEGAIIETNMTHYIELDPKQLPLSTPEGDYLYRDIEEVLKGGLITKDFNLDHGFINRKPGCEGSFFHILYKNKGIKLCFNDSEEFLLENKEIQARLIEKGKIPLKFYQVYTPDRKRIAIEPQSIGANAFNTGSEYLKGVNSGEKGLFGVFNIQLAEI